MSEQETYSFSTFQSVITSNSVIAHASEVHGLLTGLICSGFSFENTDYLGMINDCFNNGEPLPSVVKNEIKLHFNHIWENVLDDQYAFQLLLPDDDESISERGKAISVWVQGFNLGFGLQHKDMPVTSDDVKEVIADFAEIANLSDDVEEDEANEQAFYEIAEYVRISSLLIFSELGEAPSSNDSSETIH